MAWSILQSVGQPNTGSAASITATYTSNLTSGTKLICFATVDNSGNNITSVQDGSGNSFTQITFELQGGSNGSTGIWVLDTPTGDVGTTPTITVASSGGHPTCIIWEVSGLATGNTSAILDGTAGTANGTASGTIGPPTYSSSASNELIVYLYGDDGPGSGGTDTAPSGYTADTNNQQGSGNSDTAVAYKNSTGGTETGTWSIANVSGWALILVAFKLAATGPAVTTTSLPPAYAGVAYSQTLAATGGTTPYSWSISSGSLPSWASLNSSTGVISGTPTTASTVATFTVQVTDAGSNTATKSLTLDVNPDGRLGTSARPGLAQPGNFIPGQIGGSSATAVSSSDTGHGTDAGETIRLSDGDTGHGTDGGETARLSDTDTSPHATDAGEGLGVTTVGDTGHGTDAGEGIAATVPSGDTGHATDAGEGVRLSDSDTSPHATDAGEAVRQLFSDSDTTPHAADGGELVTATVPSGDTGHATDAGEHIAAALSDSDTSHAADAGEHVAAALSDSDTSHGTDAGEAVHATVPAGDTSHATDAGELVSATVPSGDTSHATDAGEAVHATLSDSDAGHGTGSETVTAHLSDSDVSHGTDGGESGTGSTTKTDSDSCHGTDSGFSFVSDSDSVHGADGEQPFAFTGTDTSTGTERELTAWPADSDVSTSASTEHWSGPLSDGDTSGPVTETVMPFHFSDSDSCHGTDGGSDGLVPGSAVPGLADPGMVSPGVPGTLGSSGTEVVEIWTNQPPFRWAGAWYQVTHRGQVLWSGPHPDRFALWLNREAAAGRLEVVRDSDSVTAADSESPVLGVTLIGEKALQVTLEAEVIPEDG